MNFNKFPSNIFSLVKDIISGKVVFSKEGEKINQLHTTHPEPGKTYFILRVKQVKTVCYVKAYSENEIGVIYQLTPGKKGAAIFTQEQANQFMKDFPGNVWYLERYE